MFLSKDAVQKKLKIIQVDFTKPWWQLITQQKGLFTTITLMTMVVRVFWSMSPFLISLVFEHATWLSCAALFSLWIVMDCINAYARQLNTYFQINCIHNIYYNAHTYLLTIDPRYHVHRSSGSILGKIERAARGYEEILDQITFEFVPLMVGLITMIITISKFSAVLALSITGAFFIMVIAGYYFAVYACRPWEQDFIVTDDAFKQTAAENLSQIQLIRATFASNYSSRKLSEKVHKNMRSESTLWMAYITTTFALNMFYVATIFALITVLVFQVKQGITTIVAAVGLALAYLHSTKELVMIVKPFRRYMRGWSAVSDLFNFISHFGKQTYPVLGPVEDTVVKDHEILVEAVAICFDYERAQLFNNHSLRLQCKHEQAHKLYGIIGPSGSGKTTLLSILGGQLKPVSGTVLLNNTDIYLINDATRMHLIALQGQIATNLKGSVKYNLTFGLPQDHPYDDLYLIAVLEKVGLLSVLSEGLYTMLGEGGLNLSGGQRQRLNFASLYLRAQFYKPLVILIDEPTSSLDEISEAAITDMIVELAQHMVTLVIAHRLKTVENAVGLFDLSLLREEKEIIPYAPSDLVKRSEYYAKLVAGKIRLDS